MTCQRVAGAIFCSRERRQAPQRRPRPAIDGCRFPGCERRATQAGYACRAHWFRLTPDLRSRLWRADRDDRQHGRPAWSAVAYEADRWIEQRELAAFAPDWRSPELPL